MPLLTDQDRLTAEHLGDGLYATFDGHHIWLFASNGETKTEPVALERGTYISLQRYACARWGSPVV